MIDDFIALDIGIGAWHVFQRKAGGLGEEAHEAEANIVLFREQVLVLLTRFHDRAHVAIVEGSEQRGLFLRALQPLGDGLAHPGHLDAFFTARAAGWGGGCSRGRGGRGRRRAALGLRLSRGEHVFLGQPAILAAALDSRGVNPVFQHRAAHRGRQGLRRIQQFLGRRRSGRSRISLGRRRGRRGRGWGFGGRGSRAFIHHRDHRADFDRVAHRNAVFGHDARHRRRHVNRDLVGFEADDGLIGGDCIAGLF